MAGAMEPELILPAQFQNTPIHVLRMTSRRKIGMFLNLDGFVILGNNGTTEIDIINDYNGLAELAGFTSLEISNLARMKNPTEELLLKWGMEGYDRATVGLLWKYLTMMGRLDVITECRRSILIDCRQYEEQTRREESLDRMVQDPEITNSDTAIDETRYATIDDVRTGNRTHYYAFVCHTTENAADRAFVREMIENIEIKRGLKLFVPGRDDLPGSAEHSITAYLIECRCQRVAIVMSPAFLRSDVCEFQVKFAHALAPDARSKRLIPIVRHKNINMPRILKYLATCDFTKLDMYDWVWDRLAAALEAPIGPVTHLHPPEDEHNTPPPPDLRTIYYPSQLSPDSGLSDGSSSMEQTTDTLPKTYSRSNSDSANPSSSTSGYQPVSRSAPDNENEHILGYQLAHPGARNQKSASLGSLSEVQRRFKPASTQQFNSTIVRTNRNSGENISVSYTSPATGQAREVEESEDDEKTVIFRDRKWRQT